MPFRRTAAVVALSAVGACSDSVEIRIPVDLTVNPKSLRLSPGTVSAVDAVVTGVQDPARLEWRSLAPGIATLDSIPGAGPMSGAIVRGVAPGATSIVVTVVGRPDVADTVAVTVYPAFNCPLGPVVTPNVAQLAVGDTVRIRVTVPRQTCSGQPADTDVVWTSVQPAIANVDSFGLVTGLAPGVAIIRVAARSAPNIVATATVTVR